MINDYLFVARFIDQGLYNGPLGPRMCNILGMSKAGCPYRGTSICHQCPFEPITECDYRCQGVGRWGVDCDHRYCCRCGWDQTERLRDLGIVG